MKKLVSTCAFLLTVASGLMSALAQTYDPDSFAVTPMQGCYNVCPAGDVPFSFCISYRGQPLAAPPSEVMLTLECLDGDIVFWNDVSDKCSYFRSVHYDAHDCNSEYWWHFLASGCCNDAKVSLRMKDAPTPFYEIHTRVSSFDVNMDGSADAIDSTCIANIECSPPPPYSFCYDVTCDGNVDETDLWWTIRYLCAPMCAMGHMNHSYLVPMATREATWGAIKALYGR